MDKQLSGGVSSTRESHTHDSLDTEVVSPAEKRQKAVSLVLAAQEGQTDLVKYQLSDNAFQVNETATIRFPWGSEVHHCTALNAASIGGHLDTVNLLLQHGASTHTPDCGGATPFCEAAYHGKLDVMQCLYRHGADINSPNSFGWSPLHVAVSKGNKDIVRYLLEIGADVNQTTPEGYTAMHVAAATGGPVIVKQLLKHGLSPLFSKATPSIEGYVPCPLFLAATVGSIRLAREWMSSPECPSSCKCDAWLLNHAKTILQNVSRGSNIPYQRFHKALSMRKELCVVPEYLPPIELYGNRSELGSLEKLEEMHDGLPKERLECELLFQSLIVQEKCMGHADPELFWSLTRVAQSLLRLGLHSEGELLLLRAVDTVESYRLPHLEKGYILPQTFESEIGRWIEKSLTVCLLALSHNNCTPRFGRYIRFALKLFDAVLARIEILHSQYGCDSTTPKYLLENILLLFHVWLYHNSRAQGKAAAASAKECEELGRSFTEKHLWTLKEGSSLLHLAITSEKDLYLYLAVDQGIQHGLRDEVRQYLQSCSDPLLICALLQWGAQPAINHPAGAAGERPLHLAVLGTTTLRKTPPSQSSSTVSTLLAHGAHPDAVNRAGKTAMELCHPGTADQVQRILSPLAPPPLACLACHKIVAELSYKKLALIPPRIRTLISFHDTP